MVYGIECKNNGKEAARSVVIANPIPAHTEYVACSGGGQFDPPTRQVMWHVEELERREEVAVNLAVRVKSPLQTRTPIINRASVTCEDEFFAAAVETTIVLSAPAWSLSTVASPSAAVCGQSVTFTTVVRNTGNMNAMSTTITNPISDHTSYAHNTGGGVFDADVNTVIWDLGPIHVNEEKRISLTVLVAPDAPPEGTLIHRAYVQSGGVTDSFSTSIPLISPLGFELFQNHPNPFNQTTTISFRLVENGSVCVRIYDILGHVVKTVTVGAMRAGACSIDWDGRDAEGSSLSSGVYVFTLSVDEGRWSDSRRMVLLR